VPHALCLYVLEGHTRAAGPGTGVTEATAEVWHVELKHQPTLQRCYYVSEYRRDRREDRDRDRDRSRDRDRDRDRSPSREKERRGPRSGEHT
jgi:hypothetical protein